MKWLRLRKEFQGLLLLCVLYIVFSLLLPTDSARLEKYGITEQQAKLLSLTIMIPLVAIWVTAFNGYIRFKDYAISIKKGDDGPAFNLLATGTKILAYGLPINSLSGLLANYLSVQNVTFFEKNGTIITNYIAIIIALLAFIYINQGARTLLNITKKIPPMPESTVVAFLILSISYCYAVFGRGISLPSATTNASVYTLPTLVVALSVVLPYLYTWYKGLIAAYCLRFYEHNVSGILYKRGLRHLSLGIAVVILSQVLLQFTIALANNLADLKLKSLLIVIYLLLLIIGIGYALIARGANKLRRIEEVS